MVARFPNGHGRHIEIMTSHQKSEPKSVGGNCFKKD